MGFEMRVCPRSIGSVVVEQIAGMMYLLKVYHHIIVMDYNRCRGQAAYQPTEHHTC